MPNGLDRLLRRLELRYFFEGLEGIATKTLSLATITFLGLTTHALADPITGTWASETNDEGASLHVEIYPCDGAICGRIAKVLGHPDKSPEGRQMIFGMVPQGGGEYRGGKVWAPDNDKTYRGKLLLKGDRLTMSGCVLGGVICRGSDFTRLK